MARAVRRATFSEEKSKESFTEIRTRVSATVEQGEATSLSMEMETMARSWDGEMGQACDGRMEEEGRGEVGTVNEHVVDVAGE